MAAKPSPRRFTVRDYYRMGKAGILTADDRVKILDFGLARVEVADPGGAETGTFVEGRTDPGTAVGTVGYMSPEQLRGLPWLQRRVNGAGRPEINERRRVGFLQLSLQAQKINASSQAAAAYFDYLSKRTLASQYSNKVVPETVRLEEMSEDSYKSGKSNLLSLIDSQRRLNEVRRAYLDNLFSVQGSFANLEEVLGAPLD